MRPYDDIVTANRAYVASTNHRSLPVRPSRSTVVVTCMDSRIDAFAALGLELGEAHVVRVAGARVTDDVLRSLALSTHVLGTRAVVVVGHTDCGLRDPDGTLVRRLAELMGHDPEDREWHAFDEPEQAVREDCARLLAWPDRPEGLLVGGYVLDVATGGIDEVAAPRRADPPT